MNILVHNGSYRDEVIAQIDELDKDQIPLSKVMKENGHYFFQK